MKINLNHVRLMMACAIITLHSFTASAQKLPNVQVGSVHAPTNIKIDGRSTEWGDKFKAHNNATELFYTLANDSDNLYLLVKATDKTVINKIIKAGLTLTVNTSGKKDDKNGIGVTFPLFNKQNGFNINLDNKPDPAEGQAALDSFMRVVNKNLSRTLKEFRTKGMTGIPDTVSVYNDVDIKAKAQVDANIHYVYELSVPLKYFGLSAKNGTKFIYNIRSEAQGITSLLRSSKDQITSIKAGGNGSVLVEGPTADKIQALMSVTDFWGEYTLAK